MDFKYKLRIKNVELIDFQLRSKNIVPIDGIRGISTFKSAICNLKSFILTLSTFLILNSSFSQIYPVNVSIFTTAPHRNYLSSYADDARLRVALTLTDFSVPSRTVRLKFRFEAPNGFIHESQLSTPISYTLFSGETKVLTTEELMPYFVSSQSTQNLLYEGASSICVEVTDNQTGSLLNFNSCTYFQIDYGQPAQCVLPECESVFDIGTNYMLPTPLEFTFSPPFAPLAEFGNVRNKIYVFQYDSLIPYQNLTPPTGLVSVISGGFPFEVAQNATLFMPPPNSLFLEKGKKYVWYVRSVLIDPITGLERINQFQNNGWSMPCIFQYGEEESIAESLLNGINLEWNDALPSSFSASSTPSNTQGDGLQVLGERKALAKWKVVNENPNALSFSLDKYIVSYRKVSQAGQVPWDWHHDTTTDFVMSIYQLEPSTTYEVYVRGMLGTAISDSTPVRNITTDSTRTYACGEENLPARMPIYEPLLKLEAGNSVKIGTFDLNVTSVEALGETGHYKGYGLIPVKFLGGVNTKVRFDDLKIDKEFVVWDGTADVLTDGLNAWLDEQYIQFQDPIYVNGTVSSAYVSDSLAYVVVDGTPQSFTFPCPSCPVIINDVNGNQITIYANGTINWGTYLDVTGELLGVNNSSVGTFSQHENEIGGFDAKEHMQWHENYEIIQSLDSMTYFVPNKSMFVGEDDIVYLNVPKDSFPSGSITLNVNGNTINEVSSTEEGNIRKIEFTIPSFSSDGKKIVYALASNLKIAKLNIEVYEKLEKIVKIIPIASTNLSASSVETYLEQTLGEAGIDFTVSIDSVFTGSNFNSNTIFNIPDATLMVKYSEQMRQVRNAYFETHEQQEDTYYLFLVNALQDTINNSAVDGYMVRGKSVGFISASAGLQTIAHELGHGIGALEHSWKNNGPTEGSSSNLMDYSSNTNLIAKQWEELRYSRGSSFWDEEEDAEAPSEIAFYFWEENSDHSIKKQVLNDTTSFFVMKGFKSKHSINGYRQYTETEGYGEDRTTHIVTTKYYYNFGKYFTNIVNAKSDVKTFVNTMKLERFSYDKFRSKIQILKNGKLHNFEQTYPGREQQANNYVLYFTKKGDKLYYTKSSAKLSISGFDNYVYDHLHVVRVEVDGIIIEEKVYNFKGEDVTWNYVKSSVLNIYVNGYIWGGPGPIDDIMPCAPYWRDKGEEFIHASKKALNPSDSSAYEYYLNGTGDGISSTAGTRRDYGNTQAPIQMEKIKALIKSYEKQGAIITEINIISHSMGCAVAEGYIDKFMTDPLLKKLLKAGEIVHFSAADANFITVYYTSELKRYQINYLHDKTISLADNESISALSGGYFIDGITKKAVVDTDFSNYKNDPDHNPHFDTKAYDDAWKAFMLLRDSNISNGQYLKIPHSDVYD